MDASLLVPKSIGTERWGRNTKSAGSCMRPPPPAMESMKPARKAKTQSMPISITAYAQPFLLRFGITFHLAHEKFSISVDRKKNGQYSFIL